MINPKQTFQIGYVTLLIGVVVGATLAIERTVDLRVSEAAKPISVTEEQAIDLAKQYVTEANQIGLTNSGKPDPNRVIGVDHCEERVLASEIPKGPVVDKVLPCYNVRFRFMTDRKFFPITPLSYDVKIDKGTGGVISASQALHK